MSVLRPIDAVIIDDVMGTFFGIEDEMPEEEQPPVGVGQQDE